MNKSVYEIIKEAVTPEGVLPADFDLPREAKRDTAFIMGAADGLWIKYGQPAEETSRGLDCLRLLLNRLQKEIKREQLQKLKSLRKNTQ